MRYTLRQRLRLGTFLNGRHPRSLRVILGMLSALFTLAVTREIALAHEIKRLVLEKDDFHRAARRLSFYARRGWTRLNLSKDFVYVFCNQMQIEELDAMRRFLLRRRAAHPGGVIDCDLAYVSAMKAVVLATDGLDPQNISQALDEFRRDADAVLANIQDNPASFTDSVEDKNRESFSQDRAATALVDFSKEMKTFGQRWFVLSGTLLGIVREGGFLAHDYDIDAGVMADEVDVFALHRLLGHTKQFKCSELEWQVTFEPSPSGPCVTRKPVFFKVSHENGIYIDIFIHHREDEKIWHASSLFRWDNYDFKLAPYCLAGVDVLGPENADLYLTENYGNWRIPVKDFNSALDTTNQSVVRNPLSVAIFLRRIWMAERSNPIGAEALRRALMRGGFIFSESINGRSIWRMAEPW